MIKKIQNAICTSFFVLTPQITFLWTKIWTFQISFTAKMSKFEKLLCSRPLLILGRKFPNFWSIFRANPIMPNIQSRALAQIFSSFYWTKYGTTQLVVSEFFKMNLTRMSNPISIMSVLFRMIITCIFYFKMYLIQHCFPTDHFGPKTPPSIIQNHYTELTYWSQKLESTFS